MRRLLSKTFAVRTVALYLGLAIFFAGFPLQVFAAPTVDIKAEGADGPVDIIDGNPFSYSWTSTDATSCEITTPSGVSGITLAGNDGPINSDHPWYPDVGSSLTLTLDCTDGTNSTSDSVTINIVAPAVVPVTVDIKVDGSDAPAPIASGTPFSYSWTSTGATACQLTSPSGVSGITLAGNDGPIISGHPWYPTATSSTTLTLDCTNGSATTSDSVTVSLASGGGGPLPAVTADIKAEGSDGPVTITNGNPFSYSWTSTNATACQLTSPSGVSGISLNGSDGPITTGHTWYPAVGSSTTLTLDCTNGSATSTDSVVINVTSSVDGGSPPTPSTGGGGGRSRGSSRPATPSTGQVLGATVSPDFCPYLTSYLRIGANNDPVQVLRLQIFLKMFEGYDYVTVSGVFDQATFQAVSEFQLKYQSEVLTPWGISAPTGYVYILTLSKINQILCGTPMAGLDHAPAPTIIKDKIVGKDMGGYKEGAGTSTLSSLPLIGESVSKGQKPDDGSPQGLAAALISWPANAAQAMQCLYELLLILIVLYILGNLLGDVLYKDAPENVRKKFWVKWLTISLGLVLAFFGAYYLNEYCLLLPLLFSFIVSVVWMLMSPKKDAMKNSAKSWYLAGSAKAKSIMKDSKQPPKETAGKEGTRAVMITEKK